MNWQGAAGATWFGGSIVSGGARKLMLSNQAVDWLDAAGPANQSRILAGDCKAQRAVSSCFGASRRKSGRDAGGFDNALTESKINRVEQCLGS